MPVFPDSAGSGLVAQLGERRVRNAEVEGSNPFGSTTICPKTLCLQGFRTFLCPEIREKLMLFLFLFEIFPERQKPQEKEENQRIKTK